MSHRVPVGPTCPTRYPAPMITWTPSPVIVQIGPISIPWYGVGYAIAIAVGVWLAGVEARRKGLDTSIIGDGLLWVVVAGIIGARLYHVIDQWQRYQNDLLAIVLPPYSGLGIYGGIAGGLVGLFLYSRRRGFPFLPWVDALVPSLFIGQAIARWGNFFNQELYGPPTDLPWGIQIECVHRVAAYPCSQFPFETTGFVPLFFYEASAQPHRRPAGALDRPPLRRPAAAGRPPLLLAGLVRRRSRVPRDLPGRVELGGGWDPGRDRRLDHRHRHRRGDLPLATPPSGRCRCHDHRMVLTCHLPTSPTRR